MIEAQAQTLYSLYRQQAAAHGDAVAVQGLNAADLTYRGFIAQTERISAALAAWGVGRGDRVLIQLPNGPEALVTMHGVAATAVSVLIDPRAGATEVAYLLRFIAPTIIILQQGVESSGRALAQRHGVRVIEIIPTPEMGAGTFVFAEPPPPLTVAPTLNGPDDLAFLMSTSGTTALPKLIPLTQSSMIQAIASSLIIQERALNQTVPLRALNTLPLHLLYGCAVASAALASGGSVACMPGADPSQFYAWLDMFRPLALTGPPPILEQLLALAGQYPEIVARHSIRYVNTSSAPLSDATRADLNRIFNVPIVHTYGMTEVGIITLLVLPAGSTEPMTTIGRAEQVDKTRVMADDGTFLPSGQIGEIVVQSEIFSGYWNNPDASEESFINGWFRTGDMGFMDGEARITLVGRVKEIINNGGAKVSPVEVEAVLKQHPQVTDAAVFGLKNADVGETVAAAVVGTVSERELRKFAAERLPFFKVPTRIIIVAAIPTTASGKLQRNRLAEILGLS